MKTKKSNNDLEFDGDEYDARDAANKNAGGALPSLGSQDGETTNKGGLFKIAPAQNSNIVRASS